MIRSASILLIMAGLTTLVGAQGPKTGLTAAQQQQLFQRNRAMIQTLVDSSVDMSTRSNDPVHRAKTYRKVIRSISASPWAGPTRSRRRRSRSSPCSRPGSAPA